MPSAGVARPSWWNSVIPLAQVSVTGYAAHGHSYAGLVRGLGNALQLLNCSTHHSLNGSGMRTYMGCLENKEAARILLCSSWPLLQEQQTERCPIGAEVPL